MARVTTYRQAVALWVRKYPLAPRYRREDELWTTAADGVRLRVARLDGPPSAPFTVVLVHGFLNSARTPRIYEFARSLSEHVHVIVPNLRGHGGSAGRCTLGRREPLDVAAAVELAPPELPVVTVGTSLGAAAAVLHAGTHGGVAGVVAVSTPAWSGSSDRPGAARAQRFAGSWAGRSVAAAFLRTRIEPCRDPVTDIEARVASVAPAFTIVVHDPDDHYFGGEHAQHIFDHARPPKDLWWYSDAGHGTDLLTPAFADRVLAEVPARLAPQAIAEGQSGSVA